MSQVQPMMTKHAGVQDPSWDACRKACSTCAQACRSCADACATGPHPETMTECARLALACTAACEATGKLLAGGAGADWKALAASLDACAVACASCATECDRHARTMEHCRVCAEACRACEAASRELRGEGGDGKKNVASCCS